MRPLAFATFLFLLASSRAFAGDCDGCMATKMCIRHQKEQDDTMKAAAKGLRSKEPGNRKEALDRLGKLNDNHLNHRSKELAVAIADLLDDTDSGVRMGAVEYLGKNQDVKTARAEIGKMLERLIPRVST